MIKWNKVMDKMPNDQDSVLLREGTLRLIVEAWFDDGPQEWVCFDDKFSLPISGTDEWAELPE